ncbi:hypothetical protein BU15DRAFT_79348 [Melanogaster broomeanus]|nr:hypothetical protein BU15DRAFT_79348 [Melanogaster broomeanus]
MNIILDVNYIEWDTELDDIRSAVGDQLRLIDSRVHNDYLQFWKATCRCALEDIAEELGLDEAVHGCFSAGTSGKVFIAVHSFTRRHAAVAAEVPQIQEDGDILTDMNESFKRTTNSMSRTPSQAIKSSEYLTIQRGDRKIFDGRWAADGVSTIAPPIQLFNPAFAYFSSKAFDPEYNVPHDFIRDVRDVMTQFARIHTSEEARGRHLQPLLQKMINHPLVLASNRDGTVPDALAVSSHKDFSVYLIVGEEKNEFGDGGPDPSVQASFSFLRIFCQAQNHSLGLRCCCPTFIISHAGPWFAVLGGIITANCVVQRLTDFLWIPPHSTHDEDHCFKIGRVMYALRESIQRLDVWYKTMIDNTSPHNTKALRPAPHPRFFPSPDEYLCDGARVKFSQPVMVVVKFVTRYGEDAHREMAAAGFAPRLLYYGPINIDGDMPSYGSLRMVVMEYVDGQTFESAARKLNVSERIHADLARMIARLHAAGFVFGDLRAPNIVVTQQGQVQLIDFDWAGKEGEVTYPVSVSNAIQWPEGVRMNHRGAEAGFARSPASGPTKGGYLLFQTAQEIG